MSETRYCQHCGELLERRRKNGKLESNRDFKRRKFCDRSCSGRFAQKKQRGALADEVKVATEAVKAATGAKQLNAIDFLTSVFNDATVDKVTRVNAAKAVAPYTHKKANEAGGKRQGQVEQAKKTASGRFSAGSAPKLVQGGKS